MGEYTTIKLDHPGPHIARITFDRPEVRNALNGTMASEIGEAIDALAGDDQLRCLIFTGSDRSFVSGADISELRDRKREDALRRINTGLFRRIETFPAPTIAAIRGFALGGGCELAMACDLRIAGEGARFGQPEVGLGILPGAGGTYRLVRLVGLGRARELVYTGRIIDAEEAHAIQLVNRIVPDDAVLEAATELATEIGKNSVLAVRFSKLSLNATHELSSDAGMLLESTAQAVLFETEDKVERMTAFLEKRKNRKSKGGSA
jgi:enoyl-CoA hydratase